MFALQWLLLIHIHTVIWSWKRVDWLQGSYQYRFLQIMTAWTIFQLLRTSFEILLPYFLLWWSQLALKFMDQHLMQDLHLQLFKKLHFHHSQLYLFRFALLLNDLDFQLHFLIAGHFHLEGYAHLILMIALEPVLRLQIPLHSFQELHLLGLQVCKCLG